MVGGDKRHLLLDAAPRPKAARVGRVLILAPEQPAGITPLAPADAVIELLRHSFAARTLASLRRTQHFTQCVALARAVPIARLGTSGTWHALDSLACMVESFGA